MPPGIAWKSAVGRSYAAPAGRVEVGREAVRRVKAPVAEFLPCLRGENLGVDLALPEHCEFLALRVVVDAGEADERGLAGLGGGRRLLHEPLVLADVDELAGDGRSGDDGVHVVSPADGAIAGGLLHSWCVGEWSRARDLVD